MSAAAIVVLVCGLAALVVSAWAARRAHNAIDFILCGGRLSHVPLGMSVAAAHASGFVLWGVAAAAYVWGSSAAWLAGSVLLGAVINWLYVAPRLRALSLGLRSPTMIQLLGANAGDRMQWRVLYSAVLIVVIVFGLQCAAQLQLGAALLATLTGWDQDSIVLWAGALITLCIFMAGLWSVTFVEAAQVVSVVCVLLGMLIVLQVQLGSVDAVGAQLTALGTEFTSVTGGRSGIVALAFIMGVLGNGLIAPGQPHLVHRYLAARDEQTIAAARWPALISVAVLLGLAMLTGWVLRAATPGLDGPVALVNSLMQLLPPSITALVVVALAIAVMASIGTQSLLVAAGVALDLRRSATELTFTWARVSILIFVPLTCVWALYAPAQTIDRMAFCWTAMGTTFGPLLLVRLSGKHVRPGSVLGSLWSGFLLVVLFHLLPDSPGDYLERIIPFVVALGIALTGGERRRNPDRADRAQETLHDRMPI